MESETDPITFGFYVLIAGSVKSSARKPVVSRPFGRGGSDEYGRLSRSRAGWETAEDGFPPGKGGDLVDLDTGSLMEVASP